VRVAVRHIAWTGDGPGRLSAQCMEIVRTKDHGTLQYEIFFNDDESECIVIERYKDSDALVEHGANLGGLMEAILATGAVSGELLGEPSAKLRVQLIGVPVRLFTPFLSMLANIPARYRTMVLLAIETGLRWGELISLRPCDIDVTARINTVRRTILEVAKKNSPTGQRCFVKDYPKDDEQRRISNVPGTSRWLVV